MNINMKITKKDTITKKELLDKLASLPDDAAIHFSAWSYEEMDNGRIRQYSLSLESIEITTRTDSVSISLNGENHYKDE